LLALAKNVVKESLYTLQQLVAKKMNTRILTVIAVSAIIVGAGLLAAFSMSETVFAAGSGQGAGTGGGSFGTGSGFTGGYGFGSGSGGGNFVFAGGAGGIDAFGNVCGGGGIGDSNGLPSQTTGAGGGSC
jgi:uncharacterized membrane protein